MKSTGEASPLRQPVRTGEPLHVFVDRAGTGAELHVYDDHLELHSVQDEEVLALWYRYIRKVAPSREGGRPALAITGPYGQIVMVPMADDEVTRARWLIGGLIEWAKRGV